MSNPLKKAYAGLTRYVDSYVLLLMAVVVVATILPATGPAVAPVDLASQIAIMFLFFLYGARLTTEETVEGFKHWRLHLLVLAFTFVAFPALGLLTKLALDPWMSPVLVSGVLFLTLLPSTVQSSVTFTSMARGNVPASICAASFSNLAGVVLTPLLVMALMGGTANFSFSSVEKLLIQLVLPFFVGQLLHRRIGGFLARNKSIVSKVDRLAILLVVYTAFSAGMREQMWSRISVVEIIVLLVLSGVLLTIVLVATLSVGKWLGFSWPDRIAIAFAGSKKSMASGLPMAQVLFSGGQVGILVLPLMLFHQLQLIVCAQLARRWASRAEEPDPVGPAR